MTGDEYKAAIARLGLSQEAAGQWMGLSKRTGQNYAIRGAPSPVGMLLGLMLRFAVRPGEYP
jgi:hypothetical protein